MALDSGADADTGRGFTEHGAADAYYTDLG
jgi:hypothetical protein